MQQVHVLIFVPPSCFLVSSVTAALVECLVVDWKCRVWNTLMVDFFMNGNGIRVAQWEVQVTISSYWRVMTASHFTRTIVRALLMLVHIDNTASSHPDKDRRTIEVSTTL